MDDQAVTNLDADEISSSNQISTKTMPDTNETSDDSDEVKIPNEKLVGKDSKSSKIWRKQA